jgi:plasmid stabilization system protein ParE
VRYHPAARREYDAAIGWYEADYPGRGRRFFEAVESRLDRIEAMPLTFPLWSGRADVRACGIPHFPYTVFFVAHPEGPMVYAVAHDKRRPGYWKKRIAPR